MTLFAFSIPLILYNVYGYVIPIVILAALYGFRWKIGMWGNTITLGAVLFSILIAFGWWEDVAYLLSTQVPPMLFIADCISIWVIFLISLLILDTATRYMSTVKVKYNEIVENVGNGIALFLLFGVLFQFTIFANGHLGMVGENPGTASPGTATNATISALQILSAGNLSGFSQTNKFDASNDFVELNLQRRQALMLNVMRAEGPIQGIQADDSLIDRVER